VPQKIFDLTGKKLSWGEQVHQGSFPQIDGKKAKGGSLRETPAKELKEGLTSGGRGRRKGRKRCGAGEFI